MLGVEEVDKHEKYLGFPPILGRSKIATFWKCQPEGVEKDSMVAGKTKLTIIL